MIPMDDNAHSFTGFTGFAELPRLTDGVIELELERAAPGDPVRAWVPAYHFRIKAAGDARTAGALDLRIGDTEHLRRYGGHLGYTVDPPFRGQAFAARACRLVAPIARHHGLRTLWITCAPDNWASRRTCERVGARFVEIVALPRDCDMYARGERRKCRYRWDLVESSSRVVKSSRQLE